MGDGEIAYDNLLNVNQGVSISREAKQDHDTSINHLLSFLDANQSESSISREAKQDHDTSINDLLGFLEAPTSATTTIQASVSSESRRSTRRLRRSSSNRRLRKSKVAIDA